MQRVAVLGGGVAGLTAADELSQRHFEVDVFERRDRLGGKARSYLTDPPPHGLDPLPAEHGFRFVPGFYRHLPDTMRKIPYQGNFTVHDNLIEGRDLALMWPDKEPTVVPSSAWGFLDPQGVKLSLSRHPFTRNFGLNHEDLVFLTDRLQELLSTCRERRLMELESSKWWDYCGADTRQSANYRRMMLAMTRSLVAARAEEMSARTGGDILVQLQLATYRYHGHPDRLLNGPTSDVWIEPWRQKLEEAGVSVHLNHQVTGFSVDVDQKKLTGVTVSAEDGKEETLTDYDWYVCALPVEIMQQLVDDNLKRAAPTLADLGQLTTRWMNGYMLYLRRDVKMVKGHSIYVDSPWALTSVSQAQFWAPEHLAWRKEGEVEGILSLDISDWDTEGDFVKKPACECSPEEIRQEVLGQLHQYGSGSDWDLSPDNIAGDFIDQDIVHPNPAGAEVNLEPLFINTAGSWAHRPASGTDVRNLFLASDYVRTYTDLATMEGANESGRRAVNFLLDAANSTEDRCELWPLHEPHFFSLERHFDCQLYERRHSSSFTEARHMLQALRAADTTTDD